MALTSIVVAKVSVSQIMLGQWSVVFRLQGFDGATELFSQTFTEDYKTGNDISRVEAGFAEKMQAAIDRYKAEQQYFSHNKMNMAVSNVQAALEV